jgi:hypothetical protein
LSESLGRGVIRQEKSPCVSFVILCSERAFYVDALENNKVLPFLLPVKPSSTVRAEKRGIFLIGSLSVFLSLPSTYFAEEGYTIVVDELSRSTAIRTGDAWQWSSMLDRFYVFVLDDDLPVQIFGFGSKWWHDVLNRLRLERVFQVRKSRERDFRENREDKEKDFVYSSDQMKVYKV